MVLHAIIWFQEGSGSSVLMLKGIEVRRCIFRGLAMALGETQH